MAAFVISCLLLVIFIKLTRTANIDLKYIGRVSHTSFKLPINGRFVDDDSEIWVPVSIENAMADYMFNDTWKKETDVKTPMFRNNKFIIRYKFNTSKEWSAVDQQMVRDAHSEIEQHTCLYFWNADGVEIKSSIQIFMDYSLLDKKKCSASQGRGYSNPRNVSLGGCIKEYSHVLHETMHSLGFDHEHSRPDRDMYVDIITDNIAPQYRWNFEPSKGFKGLPVNYKTGKYLYDYYSIMHYDYSRGAKRKGLTAIEPKCKIDKRKMGLGQHLSEGDKKKLQFYYNCSRYQFLINAFKKHDELFYYEYDDTFRYRKHPNTPRPKKVE